MNYTANDEENYIFVPITNPADKHMKKKYKLPEENPEPNVVREPAIQYERRPVTELKGSPPLTEEELKDSMSTDEFKEYWFKCIDEIFKK